MKKKKPHKLRVPIPKPGHSWSKKDYNRKREKDYERRTDRM